MYFKPLLILFIVIYGVRLVTNKKQYIGKYTLFYWKHLPFSKFRMLVQIDKQKCKDVSCKTIMNYLNSFTEVSVMLEQLPSGKYKTITHDAVIAMLYRKKYTILTQREVYSDSKKQIRTILINKECPCNEECDLKLKISNSKDMTKFYYVQFEIPKANYLKI